jgi:hypothetical protein
MALRTSGTRRYPTLNLNPTGLVMTHSSAFVRLSVFACLVVFGLPAESEGCWLLKCCKRSRPVVYVKPTDPADMYEAPVVKKEKCFDPYKPAKCNPCNHMWTEVSEEDKDACVHKDLLIYPCGMVLDPPPTNTTPDHLYPAILKDQKNGHWERTLKGGKIDGYLPMTHLPKSQF